MESSLGENLGEEEDQNKNIPPTTTTPSSSAVGAAKNDQEELAMDVASPGMSDPNISPSKTDEDQATNPPDQVIESSQKSEKTDQDSSSGDVDMGASSQKDQEPQGTAESGGSMSMSSEATKSESKADKGPSEDVLAVDERDLKGVAKEAWGQMWAKLEATGWTKSVDSSTSKEGRSKCLYFPPSVTGESGKLGTDYFDNIRATLEAVVDGSNDNGSQECKGAAEVILKEYPSEKVSSTKKKGKRPRSQTKKEKQGASPLSAKKKPRLSTQRKEDGNKSEASDAEWKYSSGGSFPKRSSELGDLHQVSEIPEAGSYLHTGEESKSENYCDQIFDPQQCDSEVWEFLEKDVAPNQKEHILSVLHENNYDLKAVRDLLESLEPSDGSEWPKSDRIKFDREIFRLRKNMREVSKVMGKSVKSCLTYYLGKFKKSNHYRLLKYACSDERREKQEESTLQGIDSCCVCGDGGSLLICDGCDQEYHLECLRPRLEKVPEGYWECDQCVDKQLVDARHHVIRHTGLYGSYDHGQSRNQDHDVKSQPEIQDVFESGDGEGGNMFRPTPEGLDAVKHFAVALNSIFSAEKSSTESDDPPKSPSKI